MKILLFADLHLDPATEDNTRHAAAQLVSAAEDERPDLIVNAGDLSWKRGHIAPWVSRELRGMHVALAKVAPVVVVAGNHDLATGGVGAVLGTLDYAAVDGRSDLALMERPGIARGPWLDALPLSIACLPYPSRNWLLADAPDVSAAELNARMSAELLEVVHGLAAEVDGRPAILIYHGSIAGARTDSEQTMSTEVDVVLNEADVPACFSAILCGHIHRAQVIGRAVYPGSPAPLTFAEESGAHGYAILEGDGRGPWDVRLCALEPKHRLITIDRRMASGQTILMVRPADPDRFAEVNGFEPGAFKDARVRVLVTAIGELADAARTHIAEMIRALGAHEVRVQIERPERVRAALPEIRHDATLDSLLALWAQREPAAAALMPEITALAHEIEGELPPEAKLRARAAGYRLLALRWSNWKSYGEGCALDVEALPALTAIEGENATGKSNAAEVECFALYGRSPRGRVALGELVRQGTSEARVEAELESGGERWRVERRVKLNGKGVGAQVASLSRFTDGAWAPATQGGNREIDALIESLVGPMDLYLATRFASQGEIDRLLDLSAAELKDVLQQAFAASVFEQREAFARGRLAAAGAAVDRHEASLAVWKEEAGMLESRGRAATDSEAALATSTAAAQEGERQAAEAERAAAVEQKRLADVERLASEWDAAAERLESARLAAADREAEVAAARESLKVAEKAATQIGALAEIESRLAEMRAAREALTAREAALSAALAARDSAMRAYDGALELRRQRLAAMDREIETAQETGRRAEASDRAVVAGIQLRLDAARAQAALIARVPFGEKCAEARCELLSAAIGARGQIEPLTAEIAKTEADAASAARSRQVKLDLMEATRRTVGAKPDENAEQLKASLAVAEAALAPAEQAVAAARVDEIELARLSAEARRLASLKAIADRADALRLALEERERLATAAALAHSAAADALAVMGVRPEGAVLAEQVGQLARAAGVQRSAAREALAALEQARQAVADARAALAQAERAAARVAESAAESERLMRASAAAAYLVQAMGRNGIPYLMLERALPEIEALANHFLCEDQGSGLSIEIGAFRELQSGEARSEVAIRYANAFGTHSVSAASGFERVAIGYALRAALAELQAEMSGVQIGHWIADEGWGVMDETNLVTVGQPMLRRIAARFGRVIVISHQVPIREVCEARYRVTADAASGSRMERAA